MRVQMTREWAGPRDPFGNYTVYPNGHVGDIEPDMGLYLVAVGYAKPVDPIGDEQATALSAMREIVEALRGQNVEPTIEAVGQTIANMIVMEQQQMAAQQAATGEAGQQQAQPQPGSNLVAKTTQACEIELEGKLVKFRKGVTVYDEAARVLIAAGFATELEAAA